MSAPAFGRPPLGFSALGQQHDIEQAAGEGSGGRACRVAWGWRGEVEVAALRGGGSAQVSDGGDLMAEARGIGVLF